MNLSELFFFKVFPCIYNENDNNYIRIHDKKNCYFYHISKINEKGIEKIFSEDKRREPISFSNFFKILLSKLKDEENYSISLDTMFALRNDENNIYYYIDSMPFAYLNEYIYFNNDYCHNETEFNYHMNRYKKSICRFLKINKKCKNKFCYGKHIINENINFGDNKENNCINIIINNINNNEIDIDEGIIKFRNIIKVWKEKKEIQFKEIIDLYNYILSFENKYLSKIQFNKVKQYFNIFQKWYNDIKTKMSLKTIPKSPKSDGCIENSFDSEEINNNSYNEENSKYLNYKILKKYLNEKEINPNEQINIKINKSVKLNDSYKISKNSNLLETLKINTNVCYISKYTTIKKGEIVKYVYAMLNSSDGVIIYGGHENNNCIKGICLKRKERDKFKIWFNSEFIKILIKYEDNLKYNFYDLTNNVNDECVLVIEIKKIKSHKFLIKFPAKCLIIKEKFLNRNKNEKNKLLNEENVKELDLREYLEILRKKLLEHYSEKFKVKIN